LIPATYSQRRNPPTKNSSLKLAKLTAVNPEPPMIYFRTGGSNLKKNTALALHLAASVIAVATLLSAQQPAPSAASGMNMTEEQVNDANIQLMRQDIRSERKKVVAANMPLTETEATKFWPVYDRYIAETVKVNDVRFALLKEYAKNYETATNEQADSFIKRWLSLDQDNTQLRLKYIPEFEKVISHKKTAIFFQIDHRISMMIELQLASSVPLVKP
jgi:hypothetical protein